MIVRYLQFACFQARNRSQYICLSLYPYFYYILLYSVACIPLVLAGVHAIGPFTPYSFTLSFISASYFLCGLFTLYYFHNFICSAWISAAPPLCLFYKTYTLRRSRLVSTGQIRTFPPLLLALVTKHRFVPVLCKPSVACVVY